MAVYICTVCDTMYDEDKEGVKWDDLPDDWLCPVCASPKSLFKRTAETESAPHLPASAGPEKFWGQTEAFR